MIYFTENALRIIRQRFFYLKLTDGSKTIVYKQDKSKAQEALKKEEYKLKFSFYSMLDKTNIDEEENVYLLGVGNKQILMNKILKILDREKLNVIYIRINSKWNILFLSDNDTEKEIYKDSKLETDQWPCVVAREESINTLKTKLKSKYELLEVTKELIKIEE